MSVNLETIPVQNLQYFSAVVIGASEVAPSPLIAAYLYRGQADAAWTLQPSFAREGMRFGMSVGDALELEKASLARADELIQ